jgi:hypothetical protein
MTSRGSSESPPNPIHEIIDDMPSHRFVKDVKNYLFIVEVPDAKQSGTERCPQSVSGPL